MTNRWYILQAHSGYEKKVAQAVREKIAHEELQGYIEEIVVPTEAIVEVRQGKKINAERKFFPGYVLLKMKMDEKIWQAIRSVPRVNGFLGNKGKPQPISEAEVQRIFKQMEEGIDKPKNTISFEPGETVRINDGPFESFVGTVEEVDDEKLRLKVSVSIFGRTTPVELEFTQVTKE